MRLKNFLSAFLAAVLIIGMGMEGVTVVTAATADCKVIDVTIKQVFMENTENTMEITVGSVGVGGSFSISVYDGGLGRQKIYEGSGSVGGYDWDANRYGETVVSVPLTPHTKGIIHFDIVLTPEGGAAIHNRVSYRVFGAGETVNGLFVSDHAEDYMYFREMLKQKGVYLTVATVPDAAQINNAELVMIGTTELQNLPDETLQALAGKSILLYKNGEISDRVNTFLAGYGTGIRYADEPLAEDVQTQEYGNCIHYNIISTDLAKDSQIKNLFFHLKDASPVYAQEDGNTETLVRADSENAVLIVDMLTNNGKAAVAGSDFFSDAELSFSSDGMYEKMFSSPSYDPSDMRLFSNYNLSFNLLDWLLPQPVYREADIQTVKTDSDLQGSFVSVTGTVVTPSESISQDGTAFRDYIYLQDETGGIRVFGINTDVTYTYRTWRLNIKGYVSNYGGEREIVVFDQERDITEVSRKDHSIEPQIISALQAEDESLIGNLVRVTGKVSATGSGTLTLADDSGSVSVFVDDYIGSSAGNWPQGEYDPAIEYGCTVESTGILSKQDERYVIRIFDTANILLLYDKDGNAVEPPAEKTSRHFGGGLIEITQNTNTTVTIGEEQKELTEYMKVLVDLGIISVELIPEKDLPVSAAFPKMLEGCRLSTISAGSYDGSVRSAAVQILSALGYSYFFTGDGKAVQESLYIQQTGILDGIAAEPESLLTTKDAARMIYNALTIPFFGQDHYTSGDNQTYTILDNCILDNLDLTAVQGVISETHYTSIDASLPENVYKMDYTVKRAANDASDRISGEDLFYSELPLDAYIGQQIEAFVKNDDDNDRNIVAVICSTRNHVYRLPVEDYIGFKDGQVSHINEEGRTLRLSVAENAKLYVNGIAAGAVNEEAMEKPFEHENTLAYLYGWYTFVDNNNDGNMDYVLTEVYRDYIVNSMDQQSWRIDDKISDVPLSLYFDPTYSNEYKITYQKRDAEGKEGLSTASFEDIEKGDVLSISVARMKGRNIIWAKVVITKGSISGKISGIDESGMELQLNGTWYPYIEIDNLRQNDFLFHLGDEGKFFVNMQGIVIMKDLKSMPYTNYAFVLGYGLVGAIDETPAMAAYLSNGTWTSYYFAKTVTVRDGSFSEVLKRDELVARYLTDPETGLMTMHTKTLVNFELNDSGEIKTISFPSINATGKNDKGRLTLDRKYNQPGGDNIPELNETFTYDATLKCIDDAFLTDETIIFDVTLEEDETLDTVSRIQDRINILSVSQLRDGSAPIISLFDMGDGNECAAAITINAAREIDAAEHLFIVNNTTQMLDEYGDEVTAVYGYENGEEKQLILDYDIKVRNLLTDKEETLGSGDLILYTQNASGRVTDAHIIINVGIAKNYLPDVYGDGSLLLPKVNFYTDSANPRRVVKYYFGLVTEKYISQPYGKLVLAKDNTVFPSTLLDRREFSAIVATDDNTAFYRIDQDARKAISESGMADCIVSPSGNFVKRNGDLALVKTVNGIATDVFFITPELQ